MRTAVAVYCVAMGLLMLGWWGLALRAGAWERGDRTHAELGLHLTAEFLTAVALIAAGLDELMTAGASDAFLGAALGMLLYTAIVSPGYFVARREWPPVWMFGAIIVLTLVALATLLLG
jgi:hypothetical protein